MDLIKIGKYIAVKRKDLGMTQKQLAEKLGMSDKSVSKWERGVCLPDVSVYSELCQHLGISINEFLAGEDIAKENVIQKSEENIIEVATDSKNKQKRLKLLICILIAAFVLLAFIMGVMVLQKNKPQNYIVPVDRDSIEMKTVELLAGPDGAHIFQFTTTDEYNSLKLYISEYISGELISKEHLDLNFNEVGAPENGQLLFVPDFTNFVIKIIIATDGTKFSTEIPILEGVPNREYYGRSATGISEATEIKYNEEQALVAFLYGKGGLSVPDLSNSICEQKAFLEGNEYIYYLSYEFCKE